jgi:hypothetical protein
LSKRIPVFDTSASTVLFYKSRAKAEGMVKSGVAYQLSAEPFEIRLAKPPALRANEALLRPDRSLAMGPDVMRGAAEGVASCQTLLNFWRGATVRNGVPEDLMAETHQGSVLFMPSAGRLANQGVFNSRQARAKVRERTLDGWKILNENWEVCSADRIPEMIANGEADLVAEEFV